MKHVSRFGRLVLSSALALPAYFVLSSSPQAMARSGVLGDLNGDGQVDFQDLAMLMSNWQGSAPSFGLAAITPHIVSIHQRAVDHAEDVGCIVVINLDADEVASLAGAMDKRRGMRTLTSPAGWPEWPPPGSALEELMERVTTDQASVEALAQAMLDLLPPLPSLPPLPPAQASSDRLWAPSPIDTHEPAESPDAAPLPEDMPDPPMEDSESPAPPPAPAP